MMKSHMLIISMLTVLLLAAAPGLALEKEQAPRSETAEKRGAKKHGEEHRKKETRSVKLTWDAPTTNTDGSRLKDLTGYRIYYRLPAEDYDKEQMIELPLESKGLSCGKDGRDKEDGKTPVCTYTIRKFTKKTHYFSVRAYNKSGRESAPSNEVKK